ncbi:G2/mitotic-specific cyclin [Friedmanniomyces endolithicus]|uniref:G2/mitotic-specific cyclin n=1 Tax=Friedmanniomyces endolithicus TaxID=329885 RepID=A0AAN6FBE9_9PEZI|nr:G2/mitotic-specific cyclin [Friedmanniomyces endolithicus]
MPPARTARRAITDENAETGTQRLTRAKAAALETTAGDVPKKTLVTKRSATVPSNSTLGNRKRTALGDVSNVGKKESENVEGKKGGLEKPTLAKTAKPAGIQKQPTRTNSTRTVLGQKVANTASSDLKRPASGSGVTGHVTKKRNTSSSKPAKVDVDSDDEDDSENAPPTVNGAKPSGKLERKTSIKRSVPRAHLKPEEDDEYPSLEEVIKDAKDLDTEDLDDPLMVAEYVHEIFDYMKQLEITTQPNPEYMAKLLPETLFLAVNIIDRFLSAKVVQLDRLQLVGVTAMFIASKYEEVLSPHVQNFVHVADEGFSESEILSAERFVLASLNYDLSYPNPMNFLRRISKADNYDIQTRTLGKYLLEIGCLDHRFLKHTPSLVAAAAMYLARLALARGEWDATLSKYAGYTEHEIQPVFKLMVEYLHAPVAHDAFFRKYASKKFMKASIVLRQWAKKWAPKYLDNVQEQPSSGKTPRS